MLIAQSPLRISLGGGGTDLPSYYRDHGGFVIAAAINKYVYITIHDTFDGQVIVKYSKTEVVDSVDDIQHPIVRETLKFVDMDNPHLEITSLSDIPSGSGLGSSSSFTTALLRALHAKNRSIVGQGELADQACHIEIDRLGEPIGKQDQFIASYGGVTCFEFREDDTVSVTPLKIAPETLQTLEENLVLFFTKYTRSASNILKDQDTRSKQGDGSMISNLHFIKKLGYESKAALEAGDLRAFAEIMHVHWEHKKARTNGITNACIDAYYEVARNNGALGGKLIGAGGGGFLMFYTEEKSRLRNAMRNVGLREVNFRFDHGGCRVMSHA